MELQLRKAFAAAPEPRWRRLGRWLANARFEVLLLVLLLATVGAVTWQDRILMRTTRLTPASVASWTRIHHTDVALAGHSTAREIAPFHWSCDLRAGFAYPYCGYEIFFDKDFGTRGVDLSNLRSVAMTMVYRGPGKTFRLHLKNFDPRYSRAVNDDTAKFNRVEFATDPGRVQHVVFDFADFGVADWWLRKHEQPPKLSHPQFDNITSVDIQTGTEPVLGHHEFEVREFVITRAALTDAQWYLSLLAGWVALIGAYLAWRIRNMRGELERRHRLQLLALRQAQEAEEDARQDHLTGVLNRRGIAERYAALCRPGAAPDPVATILIDIDCFKSLNDRFGHSYGDEVLSTIAAIIGRNVRAGDAVGRWGGEEFLLLCPGIDSIEAQRIAETIRRRVEHHHFGACERVTASFGVHWCPAPGPDLAALVGLADIALYTAKRSGRNCCRLYRPGMAKAA